MRNAELGGGGVNVRFSPKAWVIGVAIGKGLGFVIGLGPIHIEIWFDKR